MIYPPLRQLRHIDKSVARTGNPVEKRVKRGKKKKRSTNFGYSHGRDDDRTRYGSWLEIFKQRWRESTHDGADAWASLAERQLTDHPKDMTLLRQQVGLSLNPSHHWDTMIYRPKYFPGIGSPMNLELAKDAELRAEAVVSGEMHHKVSYDWGLLVGCSPNPIPE